ncbi:MAG: 50S ribosomal protein L21 [[Candidatus Thermochlorobacteriaceae] bacterium GBChlB]|jgi:large subunit ribosomal protein L21|nr:MAG: 50S ribosomal protein L21 [[Candidatus Thermochlorobacteriaceae] bacterium GBChlB]
MRALVEISDKQFLVQPGDKVFVPTQAADEGATLTLGNVLLTSDGTTAALSPSSKVTAKVLRHLKGEKVLVFKKKRRKRYRRTRGHRQGFTELEILSIA